MNNVGPRSGFDAAVIGGGLSGLAAAVDLSIRGAKVLLLEQSSKLGGRCYSYVDKFSGDVVDNGQHVLVGAYHHTLRYLEIIGTRQYLRAEKNLRLPLHHPEKGFATFEVASLPHPFHLTAGMMKFKLLTLNERRQLLNVGLGLQKWNNALQQQLSRLTVDEWLTSLSQSDNAKKCLWFPISVSVMNEVPQQASALLFARSLRATFFGTKSDAAILIPTVGQTELYVRGAVKCLADHKAVILTNAEVESIAIAKDKAGVVRLKGGRLMQSGNVISALPYYALLKILPERVSGERAFDDISKFQSSPIISIHLWFEKEFMPVDYVGLVDRNIQWLFNRRRIVRESGRIKSYLSAVISGAHAHINTTKEKLVSTALREIRQVFPAANNAQLVHSLVIKEKRATFSPTNDAELFRPTARTSINNFFLAGDWTATGLPATIEGAIMSGFTAAKEVR